jgi:hypothetical protein
MSKRLQVLLTDAEYREVRRAALAQNMSIAEWVRQTLSLMRRREPSGNAEKKIQAVRAAARSQYPTADMDRMLAEIARGHGLDKNS